MTAACDELVYQTATEAEKPAILEFLLANFVHDEPLNRSIGLTREEASDVFKGCIEKNIQDPFSTVVFTKGGEIAAVMLMGLIRRDDPPDGGLPEKNLRQVATALNRVHSKFWELAPPDVNTVIYMCIESVAKKFQRRGIGKRLLTEGLSRSLLQKYKVQGFMAEATSLANQANLDKSGFKTLYELKHSEFLDASGKPMLQPDDGATGILLQFVRVEDFKALQSKLRSSG